MKKIVFPLAISIFIMISGWSLPVIASSQVTIDTQEFIGQWYISGVTGYLSGNQTITLDEGSYIIKPTGNGGFSFDVAADGTVTVPDGVSGVGGENILTFNTIDVLIDPGDFSGLYYVNRITGYIGESVIVSLIPGLSYGINAAGTGQFSFDVGLDGTVTIPNGVYAVGGQNILTFNTTQVYLDPADFSGFYYVNRITGYIEDVVMLNLVPGVSYGVKAAGTGAFSFDVDENGMVTIPNGVSAVGGQNILTFNTTEVLIDPSDYSGLFYVNWITGLIDTPVSVNLVPGVSYNVVPGSKSFSFEVAGDGKVTVTNGVSAVGGQNILTFNTIEVSIDPADFSGTFYIRNVTSTCSIPIILKLVPGISYSTGVGVSFFDFDLAVDGTVTIPNGVSAMGGQGIVIFNTTQIWITPDTDESYFLRAVTMAISGETSLLLVPGSKYKITSGIESIDFSLSEPCSIDPATAILNGTTFSINCGSPDTDDDGVPDEFDNCQTIVNPQQVDQDLDGIGNECDSDLDGNNFNNDSDNCPDISNIGQEDTDGDGVGDECDPDSDGDAVPDINDNCPSTPNADQSDSDGDSQGDACDLDDDNDGVEDTFDNCQFAFNPDQFDYDTNGQGDVCDGDIDSDGLPNEEDLCPLSPLDQLVNNYGCTGAEFIVYSCKEENFVQHGKYVSCVAHVANDAVNQGIITKKEKAVFIREAAKK
jgi:Thrombospondin type 3 repeat